MPKQAPPVASSAAAHLLSPLIGLRGHYAGRNLELVDVLPDGLQAAVLDTSATRGIRLDQYGKPKHWQAEVFTIPIFSEVERDAHPVLRALLPPPTLAALRDLVQIPT